MTDRRIGSVHGFVITKPLQLLVVMSIIEQLRHKSSPELLIVDSFAGAAEVSSILTRYEKIWGKVFFFKNQRDALNHCKTAGYKKLFIDSDVGFQKNIELMILKALHPSIRFAVYEEGLGTYRSDLYSGPRKIFLRTLGAGVHFGGNWLTSEIYVYDDEEYNVNFGTGKAVTINTAIPVLFKKYFHELLDVFDAGALRKFYEQLPDRRELSVYLASWEIHDEALETVRAENGIRIIKAHPHQKTALSKAEYPGFFVAPAGMPAEILLLAIGNLFDAIKIYHHGTSVLRYIKNDSFRYILLNQITRTRFS